MNVNEKSEYLTKDPKDQTFSGCLHLMCAVWCLILGLGGCWFEFLCLFGYLWFLAVWNV